MRNILFSLLIIVIILFRNISLDGPFKNVPSGSYIVDKFDRCIDGADNFIAPTTYIIKPSYGNIEVFLMNSDNYYNMKRGGNYTMIETYVLEPMINYHINLTKHYHKINGSCYIVTKNNNDYDIAIEWKYLYPSFWKHLIYIALRDDNFMFGFD